MAGTSPIETLKTQVTEVQDALNAGDPTRVELQKLRDICDPANMELLKAQHNADTAKLHTLITTKLGLLNALPTKTIEQQQAIDELQRASNTMSRYGVLQPIANTGNEWADALPNWAHKQVNWLQGYARDNPNVTLGVAGVGAALLAYKVFGWLWGGTKSATSAVVGGAWSLTKNVLWYGGMAFGGYSLYNYMMGNTASAAPPGAPPDEIAKTLTDLNASTSAIPSTDARLAKINLMNVTKPITFNGHTVKIEKNAEGTNFVVNGKTYFSKNETWKPKITAANIVTEEGGSKVLLLTGSWGLVSGTKCIKENDMGTFVAALASNNNATIEPELPQYAWSVFGPQTVTDPATQIKVGSSVYVKENPVGKIALEKK